MSEYDKIADRARTYAKSSWTYDLLEVLRANANSRKAVLIPVVGNIRMLAPS